MTATLTLDAALYCRVHDINKPEVFGLFIEPQRHAHGWGSVIGGAGAKLYRVSIERK